MVLVVGRCWALLGAGTKEAVVSSESKLYLNPRLDAAIAARAQNLFVRIVHSRGLRERVGILTSGTSGPSPRLVILTRAGLRASAEAVNTRLAVDSADVWGLCLPDFHVGGLAIRERAALERGVRVVELCGSGWDANEALREMQRQQVSLLSLVPTQLHDLVGLGAAAPSSLRWVLIGGDRLSPELAQAARALGWPILPSYGMTEASSTIAVARSPDDHELVVLPHIEVRSTATGFLQLRSAALFEASYRLSDEQRLAPDEEGWFTAADLVEISPDRSVLRVRGRGEDAVKINAELVSLAHLRELWVEVLGGLGAGVGALQLGTWLTWLPDARRGAEIVLVVESSELRDLVQPVLAKWNSRVLPYERVERIFVLPKFPRSDLGKIQDVRLRELLLEQLREF